MAVIHSFLSFLIEPNLVNLTPSPHDGRVGLSSREDGVKAFRAYS